VNADSQLESLSSEATVVEKTPRATQTTNDGDNIDDGVNINDDDDIDDDDIDDDDIDDDVGVRHRSGSYTLEQPSPSLVAYMTRTGKSIMETPRSVLVGSINLEKQTCIRHILATPPVKLYLKESEHFGKKYFSLLLEKGIKIGSLSE
jgi:hypothetical protein